ncbi:MAG: cytochrome c oxidase assembly protein [Chloroflexi bacterium]|nr:cytochrome c oxidase assembly protein [Chloroflexota bacterium]MDA1271362.1 cytochrome c oxidase assembly protein [Chloroflexota bacterium]
MRLGRKILLVAPALALLQLWWAVPAVNAHAGIEAGQNPFTAWNWNPLATLLLLMVAYLYLNGLNNWQRPTHRISRWQKASFFTGLFFIFIALQSPLDNLSEHMLSFHQLQHFILRMLAPLLILLGAPLTPVLRGLPPWALQGFVKPTVRSPLARAAYDKLTNPVITVFIFMAVLYLWQIPGGFNLALRNEFIHALMHITMMSSGFIFYWAVIDPKPHRSRVHYGVRVLYLGLIVLPNTILGAVITFSRSVVYSYYETAYRPFDMSVMTDQQIGGLILWVPGDMMSILVAGIVMIMWYEQEEGASNAARQLP